MVTAAATTAGARAVPRLWPGATVVCLASGPSLAAADVDACRGQHVIAVNDAGRLAPFADVLYSSDLRWWKYYRTTYAHFGGLKFSIEQAPGKGAREFVAAHLDDVTVLRNTGDRGLELRPDGLRTGRNSGAAAINLAVHFGAARVVLLGYDCGPQRVSRPAGQVAKMLTHFFGDHPVAIRSASPYNSFQQHFAAMAAPLAAAGVAVVNCSATTQLRAFPRRPFVDEVATW